MTVSIHLDLTKAMKPLNKPTSINRLRGLCIHIEGKILGNKIKRHLMIWIFLKFRIDNFMNKKSTNTTPEREISADKIQGSTPLTLTPWVAKRKDQKFLREAQGTKLFRRIVKNHRQNMRKRADSTILRTMTKVIKEGMRGKWSLAFTTDKIDNFESIFWKSHLKISFSR